MREHSTKSTADTLAPEAGTPSHDRIEADLVAMLVAVGENGPKVMTLADGSALPSGPFQMRHRSLQSGLRAWVEQQTKLRLGYVEQLYTFADQGRSGDDGAAHIVSISYLGLTVEIQASGGQLGQADASWRNWYDYFPWEDHRAGQSHLLASLIVPRLTQWALSGDDRDQRERRRTRVAITFGVDGHDWNEELVLQRYELLFEAGLITESRFRPPSSDPIPGEHMTGDHRRILATGMARLRAKIKYRPVVFELLPATFTLLRLQRCVEALAGLPMHKGNFRRLIEQQDLVEDTGAIASDSVGRPAKLFRFRHAVLAERSIAGSKLPVSRA